MTYSWKLKGSVTSYTNKITKEETMSVALPAMLSTMLFHLAYFQRKNYPSYIPSVELAQE